MQLFLLISSHIYDLFQFNSFLKNLHYFSNFKKGGPHDHELFSFVPLTAILTP